MTDEPQITHFDREAEDEDAARITEMGITNETREIFELAFTVNPEGEVHCDGIRHFIDDSLEGHIGSQKHAKLIEHVLTIESALSEQRRVMKGIRDKRITRLTEQVEELAIGRKALSDELNEISSKLGEAQAHAGEARGYIRSVNQYVVVLLKQLDNEWWLRAAGAYAGLSELMGEEHQPSLLFADNVNPARGGHNPF
jgi:hypothetical protein